MLPIRRVDTATGTLLFIFQAFLLDQSITIIPLRKIFRLMEPFHKSESAIRMGLSREVKNGLLINQKKNGEICYGLSSPTIDGLQEWRTAFKRFQSRIPRQINPWSGVWTIAYSEERNVIEPLLVDCGFGLLSRNTWLCPHELLNKDLEELKRKSPSLVIFQSQRMAGLTNRQITDTVWPIPKMDFAYLEFIKSLDDSYTRFQQETNQGRAGLPFLYRIGMEIYELIQADPQLPLALLPEDWQGIRAFQQFDSYRTEILQKSKTFVFNILENGEEI